MRKLVTSVALLVAFGTAIGAEPATYRLLKSVPVPGDGGWDYLIVDDTARRVYISHATQVNVLDADTYEVKGSIAGTKGVHGIALAPELGRGFTSNGQANAVTIFDLKTLKAIDSVPTGKKPDAIIYDPATKRVFVSNGGSDSVTVIEAADGKVAGTIELGGQPEFAAADGTGNVFVNLEDKEVLVRIDSRKMTVLDRWSVAPGKKPCSLAMDTKNRRLFVGCRSKQLIVLNADNGKVVADLPLGDRVDATMFDPETALIFSSNGDGTITVVHQDSADKYKVVETIKTKTGSKTMALDRKTHNLFVPTADLKPRPVPGTFAVMVFGK